MPRQTEVVEDEVATVVIEAAAEDPAEVRARLEEQLAHARAELDRAPGKLANERFIAGAPAEVVEAERAKVARFEVEVRELEDRLGA